jgi:2'-5' RNA ligase
VARGATARLFVAVDPPVDVGAQLAAWARGVAASTREEWSLRVLAHDTLHLTLCFLGSRPVGEIDALAAALAVPQPAPLDELSVGAPVLLPPRRPNALAVEVHDDGELGRLHAQLVASLAGASGWEPQRRRLRPHITLARVRGVPRGSGRGGLPASLPPTPRLAFTPRELVLYRSRLDPAGARYEALASCELPAAAG